MASAEKISKKSVNTKANISIEALLTARQLLASALEMSPDEIPEGLIIGQWASWDSLAHMRLILALEEHMGLSLPPASIVAIGGLKDIAAIVEEKPLISSEI